MYYTYVLYSIKSNTKYIGSTSNLKRRIDEHNNGTGGFFTKRNKPFVLVFYEAFIAKADAVSQEKFYKSGYGREVLNEKIKNSIAVIVQQ